MAKLRLAASMDANLNFMLDRLTRSMRVDKLRDLIEMKVRPFLILAFRKYTKVFMPYEMNEFMKE